MYLIKALYPHNIEKTLKTECKKLNESLLLSNFKQYATLVCNDYEAGKTFDSTATKYWDELSKSCIKLKKLIEKKIKIVYTDYDPYPDAITMRKMVMKENIMKVWDGFKPHPYFNEEQQLIWRAVHDYFTHILAKENFDLRGELKAYNTHSRLAPKSALPALFTEIPGIVCSYIVKNIFPKQKICVLWNFDFRKIGMVKNYDIVDKKLIKK